MSTAIKIEKEKTIENEENTYEEYSVMKVNKKIVEKWEEEYNNAELAYIDPFLNRQIQQTESYSILDLLEYDPEERNQGACGNCWAWPSTAVLAIALNVQENIKDRLSVQFLNTCGVDYTSGMYEIECCGGGTLEMFANFYENINFAIPWSNTNAHWHDGGYLQCRTDCSEISKTPNYPIYEIDSKVIQTRNVPTEEAIDNIKNVLHQNKGVYFSVMYPDLQNLNDFRDMWSNDGETDSYDLDYYCGNEWNDEEAVGHAMLIVGYNDEEGTENDYWIVLNSWGTTDNRPNGLLAWDMHMNYGCKYSNNYAFAAKTLNVTFNYNPEAPEKPTITGPIRGEAEGEVTYDVSAVDPQGDDVYIYVKWGDNKADFWDGPYSSGEIIQKSHTFDEKDNYVIRAKARDMDRNEGPWSYLEVKMPKNKNKGLDSAYLDFLKQFPRLYDIIENILGL
jgi:C1A family cysteine protease